MKKLILAIPLLILLNCSFGQKSGVGGFNLGAGLAFGSEIKNIGFNVLASYDLTKNFRIAPNVTYFLPLHRQTDSSSIKTKLCELNIDGHYLFTIKENKLDIYPVAGINMAFLTYSGTINDTSHTENPSFDFKNTDTEFGVNFGMGGNYHFTGHLGAFLELKYAVSAFNQFVIKAGLSCRF